jgi:hypothetical protein
LIPQVVACAKAPTFTSDNCDPHVVVRLIVIEHFSEFEVSK